MNGFRILAGESGRLVLEGALLLPALMMLTMAAFIAAIGSGMQAALIVKSDEAAARAAFSWDNSYRNPVSGDFYPGQHDDLYWRITSDTAGSKLSAKKLEASLDLANSVPERQGGYANQIWQRTVSAGMRATFSAPVWADSLLPSGSPAATMRRAVTEPVETIRLVDAALRYWPQLRGVLSPEQGEEIVDEFRRRTGAADGPLVFDSHDEARAYLQRIVRGKIARRNTEETGSWRLIDALDAHGVAHQAYYGLKTMNRDLREQMDKDEELMRKGELKGVVWHFFRRSRDGAIGLSDALRKALTERGIIIVIHE